MFLRLMESVFAIIFFWALITQALMPLIRGTKLFPMFKREAKLQSELEDVNQAVREKELEQKITSTKEKKGV
jgi:hypothetical protein